MKILLINKFLYPKGGDAIGTLATAKLLEREGHDIILWGMTHPQNLDYPYKELFVSYIDFNKDMKLLQEIKISLRLLYSFEAKNKIERLLKNVGRPDIVHLNNFAHQISPSILDIFKKYRISMVMTMHDYKLVCPSYRMFLQGRFCERCKKARYYQCFLNKCTKNSYLKSLLNTVEMYLHHKILHIYDLIDIFISPSKFLKHKLKEMGFEKEIVYLPNFIFLEEFMPQYNFKEKTFIYVGRLSVEKGLFTLLEAVKGLPVVLKIIGDGPFRERLLAKAKKDKIENVKFLGYLQQDKLKDIIKSSMVMVLPSECYENFPRSILEAFALGKPVIGANIGGIPELVKNGRTGLTFKAGDFSDLRKKMLYFLDNPKESVEMGKNARRFVEENFNPQVHYKKLMEIYKRTIAKRTEIE
jgi:glycosyltransferase involved in cell wall biosynthesis